MEEGEGIFELLILEYKQMPLQMKRRVFDLTALKLFQAESFYIFWEDTLYLASKVIYYSNMLVAQRGWTMQGREKSSGNCVPTIHKSSVIKLMSLITQCSYWILYTSFSEFNILNFSSLCTYLSPHYLINFFRSLTRDPILVL